MTIKLQAGPLLSWALVATAARLPVSMAPLLLVFLVHDLTDDFALSTAIVAAFVIGELLGATTLGVIGGAAKARSNLTAGLVVAALAFAGLSFYQSIGLVWVSILAVVVGVGSAAAPGVLQSLLLSAYSEEHVPAVLAAARVQSTAVFLAGPTLVSVVSVTLTPGLACIIAASSLALAALLLPLLKSNVEVGAKKPSTAVVLRTVLVAWPIFAIGLAATFVVGLGDLMLVPLLDQRNIDVIWGGPILSAFFICALVGSIGYGARKSWPGSYRSQSNVMVGVMVAGLVLAALSNHPLGIAVGFLFAGSGTAILLMIRTLSLRALLPAEMHSAAFSFNYAASCLSYILCAAIAGPALAFADAQWALLIGAAAIVIIGVVASIFEPSLAVSAKEQ